MEHFPRVRVRYVRASRMSGAIRWRHGRWHILINSDAAWGRVRFSLAHEFKHLLDFPLAEAIYGPRRDHRAQWLAERAADSFAACLLMPKSFLKRAFYDEGIRDERLLRRRFQVSAQALRIRVDELGLLEPAEVAA